MPDDLRWSRCNNNRNKVHNKSKALESSPNHPLACPQPVEKLSSTKPALDAKKVGDFCFRGKGEGDLGCVFSFFFWGGAVFLRSSQ